MYSVVGPLTTFSCSYRENLDRVRQLLEFAVIGERLTCVCVVLRNVPFHK